MWIMMRNKFLILLFGLLLAVGWTNDASAQLNKMKSDPMKKFSLVNVNTEAKKFTSPQSQGQRHNAPLRSQQFNLNASAVHTKSWYEQDLPNPYVTWDGGSQLITQPFTDVDGMIALVKRVYTDKNIPGTKYSAPQGCDIPYQTIEFGWDIVGTNYYDGVTIYLNQYTAFNEIEIVDANNNPFYDWTTSSNFPSDWEIGGTPYSVSSTSSLIYLQRSGYTYAYINIPSSYLENSSGVATVRVWGRNRSQYYTAEIAIGNETFGSSDDNPSYSTQYVYPYEWTIPGCLEPPTENGYSILLVKLYDGENLNNDVNHRIQDTTVNAQDLHNYFETYIKEVQLLTDGLRVNQTDSAVGTLFAYTGDLNRFFFIGKGKMAFLSSLDALPHYDRAPFYSMYEEFSPAADSDTLNYTDFYTELRKGVTYPIVHDCNSVNFFQHYFSMAGKKSTTENRVNCLVLYIPDYRGGTSTDWRTYVKRRQPTVGMYMVDLFADIEPAAQEGYYTTTVTWEDNLDAITHSDGIPQTYYLYQVIGNDTICVTPNGTDQTTWNSADYDIYYPAGDAAYEIHYFVVATPTGATNPDTFYAQSAPDNVTVPGTSDFIGLQWWRYESDYVTDNGDKQEVNYYRNWLAPHKLSLPGQGGISAGNVGTHGRTLTLYRGETPVIDLELVMNGNKAYYRIKYRSNQEIEPGYGEDGELIRNNNK